MTVTPFTESSTATKRPPVQISSPASLLAFVPYLLRFQPHGCLVVVGTHGPRAQGGLTVRYDLPDPADQNLSDQIITHAASVLAAQHLEAAAAVGYGPDALVTPPAKALRERAPEFGVHVSELLRVEEQRYWSYLCEDPECCPPEGTPFNVDDHPSIAAIAASGAPVLASREELAASLAPVDGETGDLMYTATRAAEERATRLVARVGKASVRQAIAATGVEAVIEAVDTYRRGGQMPPGDALAWLSVMLRELRVRDDAWARMDPGYKEAHLRLWTDLTRLARPGYIAPAASLLAFVAWQTGNGALANVALDRALDENPQYSLALLLRQALDSGAPPSMARKPMTPEEVTAAYDDPQYEGSRAEDDGTDPGDEPDATTDDEDEGDSEPETEVAR
jgi:hypothetical protein